MRIRKLRRLNRLSCKELGEIIDISLDSILHLERGVFNPTYTNIIKLHNFFGDSIIVDDYSRYVISDNNIKIKEWRKKNNIKSKMHLKYLTFQKEHIGGLKELHILP